jgi:hypothetical protein
MFKNSFLPSRKNKLHLNNEGNSVNTASVNKQCLFRELHTSSDDVKNEWSYTSALPICFHSKNNDNFSSSENHSKRRMNRWAKSRIHEYKSVWHIRTATCVTDKATLTELIVLRN